MARDKNLLAGTYWFKKGKHSDLHDKLHKLIPDYGEVANADANPALEEFRVACNLYYDLYNNGLCNLYKEFAEVFGFEGPYAEADGEDGEDGPYHDPDWYTKEHIRWVEGIMNRLILKAAKEQEV